MGGNSGEGMTGGGTGSCDDGATWGDGWSTFLGKGGISHGRGMRSSKEGVVHLAGGNGILSVCWVMGIDVGKDGGRGTLAGLGVSSIGTSGSYCSIDEYSRRCDPQGTRGSGGDATQGDSTGDGVGIGTNGDGSTRGGDGTLGTTGGSGMTSLGRDNDGWMNCQMTGIGLMWGGGAVTGADGSGSGITVMGAPVPPEGP